MAQVPIMASRRNPFKQRGLPKATVFEINRIKFALPPSVWIRMEGSGVNF